MTDIDELIAAKRASGDKRKSRKSRRKKHSIITEDDASNTSNKKQPSDANAIAAERKKERRMHNLASSGLPKEPPEITYNLAPTKKEKKRKKKSHHGDRKAPPEYLISDSNGPPAYNSDLSSSDRMEMSLSKETDSPYMSSGVASMPGVKHECEEDLSRAERIKYGHYNSTDNNISLESMPGVKHERSDDVSQAERLKHGHYESANDDMRIASMPGVKQEREEDVSEAERLKYGNHEPSRDELGVASMPGAKREHTKDVSQDEKLKCERYISDTDYFESGATPGAQQESHEDVSNAERLKYGYNKPCDTDSRMSLPGPGASHGENVNTSEAERIKFGLVEQLKKEMKSESDNSDDEESNQTFEDRGVDMQYGSNLISSPFSVQTDGNSPDIGNLNSHASEIKEVDIWRSCCGMCTFILLIVIISLSVSLGKANRKASTSVPAVEPSNYAQVIAATVAPSESPSFAPTTTPEDYTFCYNNNEGDVLTDSRYSTIRNELVSSGITTSTEFSDNSSYQRKSLCWLAFGDRLSINSTDPFLEQRYSLATLYFGLNESDRLLDKGWLSGKTECQWKPMVECDSRTDTVVTRLYLYGNDLSGMLPKELAYLRDVTFLDLSINQLGSDAVSAIGNWTSLMSLRLSSNKFTSFPDLSVFPSLKYFDINTNTIEGQIPEALATYTNLVFLDISTNFFEGTISTELTKLMSLDAIYMHSNDFVGSVPEEVCALRDVNLEHITVDCMPPGPEVECNIKTCCTSCNYYDGDYQPFTF